MHTSISLKFEPALESLHISATFLFLNARPSGGDQIVDLASSIASGRFEPLASNTTLQLRRRKSEFGRLGRASGQPSTGDARAKNSYLTESVYKVVF